MVRLYEQTGAGFTLAYTTPVADAIRIDTGDFDHDLDPDILVISSTASSFYLLENEGQFSFTKHDIASGLNGARDLAIRDLNGDGLPDFVVSSLRPIGKMGQEYHNYPFCLFHGHPGSQCFRCIGSFHRRY
jgi:hypothetical protein